MKNIPAGVLTILATRNFNMAQLFTFTLDDGTVLRYTDGDIDLTYAGNTYSCGGQTGPYFEGDPNGSGNKVRGHWKVGTSVDTIMFDVFPGLSGTVEGIPFLQACQQGFFDKAICKVDRVYMPAGSYGDTSAGIVNVFTGIVGDVDGSRSMATFTVNGMTILLQQQLPRNIYQPGCMNTLYDSACTLARSAFAVNAAALTGSTKSVINATLAQATDYFSLGSIRFTSGQNVGFSRGIKTYVQGSPSVISLMSPFPFTPAIADTFTIYPGCDKLSTTCANKFSNLANYRGFDFVPENSTAV